MIQWIDEVIIYLLLVKSTESCNKTLSTISTDSILSNWHHYMTAQLQHFVSVCDAVGLLFGSVLSSAVDCEEDWKLPVWMFCYKAIHISITRCLFEGCVSTPSMEEVGACRLERGKKCWVTPQQLPLGQHLQSDQAEEDTCNVLFPRRWLGCCYWPPHTLLPVVIHVLRLQNEIWLLDNEHTPLSLA